MGMPQNGMDDQALPPWMQRRPPQVGTPNPFSGQGGLQAQGTGALGPPGSQAKGMIDPMMGNGGMQGMPGATSQVMPGGGGGGAPQLPPWMQQAQQGIPNPMMGRGGMLGAPQGAPQLPPGLLGGSQGMANPFAGQGGLRGGAQGMPNPFADGGLAANQQAQALGNANANTQIDKTLPLRPGNRGNQGGNRGGGNQGGGHPWLTLGGVGRPWWEQGKGGPGRGNQGGGNQNHRNVGGPGKGMPQWNPMAMSSGQAFPQLMPDGTWQTHYRGTFAPGEIAAANRANRRLKGG